MIESKRTNRSTPAARLVVALAVAALAWALGIEGSGSTGVSVGVEASFAGEGPAEMSADEVAERIQKFYRQTEDYHARFDQTYTDVAAGSAERSRGKVYFKKPGKMRWDYYDDDFDSREKVLVSDGKAFWIYEYEFEQAFKECLAESQLPTSLKFLMGEGELLEEFDITYADESSAEKPVLELEPKEPTSKYSKLIFEIDPESFQVRKTTVEDPYGNTNEIEFAKTKVNKNLPDSGFEFDVPEGTRQLNPQKECDEADPSN